MSPAMRILRRLLLLDVDRAERREHAVHATATALSKGHRDVAEERDRMMRTSAEINVTLDRLLGKIDD